MSKDNKDKPRIKIIDTEDLPPKIKDAIDDIIKDIKNTKKKKLK